MALVKSMDSKAAAMLCAAENKKKFGVRIAAALDRLGRGEELCREEVQEISGEDLKALCRAADLIRTACCGRGFALCAIASYKSGRCTENCRFCAQSALQQHVLQTVWMTDEELLKSARRAYMSGIRRFSLVLSGRALSPGQTKRLCAAVRLLKDNFPEMQLCASAGLSSPAALKALKTAGVTRLHCNLESSEHFYPQLCQSHSWQDKVNTLKAAREAGLEICSGALFGAGESLEDRVDLGFSLRDLGVKSVPINLLIPISGTPLQNAPALPCDEFLRSTALLRFILPDAYLRLAGGRAQLKDLGVSAMQGGCNAMIAGSMLTTTGPDFEADLDLLAALHFVPVP